MKHKRATVVFICSLLFPLPAAADDFGDMFGVMFRMMLTMANIMSSAMDSSNSWSSGSSPFNSFGSGWNSWPAMGSLVGFGALPGMNPWSGMGGWPGTAMGGWPGTAMGGWPGTAMGGWPGTGMGGWPGTAMGGWPGTGLSPWGSPLSGGFNPATLSGPGGLPFASGGHPAWPGGWNRFPGGGYRVSLLDGKWYGNTGEVLEVRGNRFHLRSGQYRVQGMLEVGNNLVRMFTPQTGSLQVYTFVRNQTGLVLRDASGQVLVFQQNPFRGLLHIF